MNIKATSTVICVLVLAGCKEEEPGEDIDRTKVANTIVSAICEPFQTCDCAAASQLAQASDCNDAIRPVIEAFAATAADLALRYHAECLGRVRTYFDAQGCNATDELDDDVVEAALFDVSQCKLVSGKGSRGQPCSVLGGPSFGFPVGDTCDHELFCDGVLCRPFPRRKGDFCGGSICPPGLLCLDPEGDGVRLCSDPITEGGTCNPHDAQPCDTDLSCDPLTTQCVVLPEADEPCLGGVLCQEDLICMAGTCFPLPGVGQQCSGGICDPTVAVCDPALQGCVALPVVGENCIATQCAEGLQCGPGGTCIERPAAVCSIPDAVGLCLYVSDGICDEPDVGTGLCPAGTDELDCAGVNPPPGTTGTTGGGTLDPTLDPTLTGTGGATGTG